MNFTDILTWVILLIFVYLIYTWFFASGTTSTLSRINDATQLLSIPASKIPPNPSPSFSFSICYYLDDWNYKFGKSKILFERLISKQCSIPTNEDNSSDGKDPTTQPCPSPRIEFGDTMNNLTITLATFSEEGSTQNDTLVIDNVPLQKWTSLILTVNGRAMDVYLDGKLINTKILTNIPTMSDTTAINLTPNGGFSGSTANFEYHAKSLNPREAYNKYKEGCGSTSWLGGLFNKYRLKLSFLKDNHEINSFEI